MSDEFFLDNGLLPNALASPLTTHQLLMSEINVESENRAFVLEFDGRHIYEQIREAAH